MSKIILENKVRAVLAQDTESRNDDIRLTQLVWWKYHKSSIRMIDNEPYINVKNLHNLPREDAISRIRRVIQNDKHEYLPTRKDVAEKRGMSETEWRNYLGYPTESYL